MTSEDGGCGELLYSVCELVYVMVGRQNIGCRG